MVFFSNISQDSLTRFLFTAIFRRRFPVAIIIVGGLYLQKDTHSVSIDLGNKSRKMPVVGTFEQSQLNCIYSEIIIRHLTLFTSIVQIHEIHLATRFSAKQTKHGIQIRISQSDILKWCYDTKRPPVYHFSGVAFLMRVPYSTENHRPCL